MQMPLDEDVTLIETERLRSVFQHAPVTLGVSALNAALTAVVLSGVEAGQSPAAWAAAVSIVSVARWTITRALLRRLRCGIDWRTWSMMSIGGSLLTGLLWGFGAVVLFPAADTYQLFLAFVVGGMCAGAVTVNSAHFPTVAAFIVPAGLPLAARFATEGRLGLMSGLMLTIFIGALLLVSRGAHATFGSNVRLQLALRREQRKLSETNERLQDEVAQRQSVEATLHQAQKMDAIGHLTGGIAHDFANLLHVIVGNLHLINRVAGDNPRVARYASEAEKAAMRGSDLTGSLLSFARRQNLQARQIDVHTLLREFEPLLRRAAPPPIQFRIDLELPSEPCFVDPSHFQSAILNLVINSRDAMPDGGELTISSRIVMIDEAGLRGNPDARPGRFVSVSIRDTGCGMTPEILGRVVEPFFTTKTAGKGTGLGLSQVYGFARQSGGDLRLDSIAGQGTCATLLLPVAPDGGCDPAIRP